MQQPNQPEQNRTPMLIALGALVGLCVVALLCAVLGGAVYYSMGGESAENSPRPVATRDTSSGSNNNGTDVPSQPGNTDDVSTPKDNNELILLGGEPPTLDPALASDATSAQYIVEIFSGLVTLDPELAVVPDIASGWEISDDGMVYTFTLREDAKFADGKPVTAEDFKYTFERSCDPATQSPVADTYMGDVVGCREKLSGAAGEVSGVRVVDPLTLEITIDEPKVYFLAKLTYPTAMVVDSNAVEAGGRLWASEQPNGSGPFVLDEYNLGERIVLTPNPNYYGDPKPSIDSATFILSGGSGMTLYETDEIDITGVGISDLDRVLDPNEALNRDLLQVNSFSVSYVGLNVDEPPFDDPFVRQAFNAATDKDTIVEVVGRGVSIPAYGILPPGMPGYSEGIEGIQYDPEAARALLAQSSYGGPEGLPDITIHVSGAGGTPAEEIEAMVQQWEENLGVDISIEQTEWATFLFDISQKPNPYQMYSVAWIADYPDPQNFLDILFHCESLDNKSGYCNPEVDTLLEQARVEQDQEARFELYQQAEQLIVSDGAWIPLWYQQGYALVKPWVKNYLFPASVVSKLKYVEIVN
jgi:oligopeptide transport system substrate-binding protein